MNSPESTTSDDIEDDRELAELLVDALHAPPVPGSLIRRIDDLVEQEWGTSPRIYRTTGAGFIRRIVSTRRILRGLPVAALIVVFVVFGVLMQTSSTAYAWNSMLEALANSGVVQVESHGVLYWLSLKDHVVGESDRGISTVIDANQMHILRCDESGTAVEQKHWTSSDASNESLLLTFLLAQARGDLAEVAEHKPRILNQHSESTTVDGVERIRIIIDAESAGQSSRLQLWVDPKTSLPVGSLLVPHRSATASSEPDGNTHPVSVSETTSAQLSNWTFIDEPAASRIAASIPVDRPVVAVSELTNVLTNEVTAFLAGEQDAAIAAENSTVKRLLANQQDGSEAGNSDSSDAQKTASADGARSSDNGNDHADLSGAASQWKPVVVKPSQTGSPVQDLNVELNKLWSSHAIQPVASASDEELMRRVYLDLVGRTPTVSEVRQYLDDASPSKYEALVDRLLASPDHSSHLAARFRSFLIPEGIDLTSFGGIEAFEKWLSERFRSGEPYDQTVRSLLLAEGRLVQSGPLLFYSATKLEPDQLAGRTARVFLGMRLECAQCHDHPFEPWTQEDFWGFAAFFGRISRPQGKLENVSTVMQVRDVARGEVSMPDSKTPVAPKFLNEDTTAALENATARRKQLTNWLVSRNNPYFARATANRVWSMMFGKGIVEPVDDFGVGSPPVSAELLDLLAGQFIQSEFDLKSLFRSIALSDAYRLSSGSEDINEERQRLFAQMNVKMLTAEQMYDCISVATMPGDLSADPATGMVVRFGNTSREQFLRDFRTPSGRATEYQGGIPQALTLMNGSLVDGATGLQSSGLLKSLEAPFFNREQRIEIIYFATLARRPRPDERTLLNDFITEDLKRPQLREALSDLLWALLNSAEFTMNH